MSYAKLALASLGCITVLSSAAFAEKCYQLDSFSDRVRLNIQVNEDAVATGRQHALVYGQWLSSSQAGPVVGGRELEHGSTTVRRISITRINAQGPSGSARTCHLTAIESGPWRLICIDSGSTFTNGGTNFAPVNCNGIAPSSGGDATTQAQ
jgi:hypothetical protein